MATGIATLVGALGPVEFWIWTGFSIIAAGAGFHAAFRNLLRARTLEDIPTARVRSAAQGYIELQGTIRLLDGPPIVAPLTQTRCTWWSYRIERRTHERNRRWRTVTEASSEALFALDDDTGRCIVDPEGAEVYPMIERRWYGDTSKPGAAAARRRFLRGRYRYTERRIHGGDPLYAIGEFRTRYVTDQWDADSEIAALLRQWKADRTALLGRFDHNRDGDIDLEEWDRARDAARREVRRERQRLDARPGLGVLAAPADGRPFLLGALPQPDLARKLRRHALAGLATFAAAGLAATVLIVGRFG